MSKRIQLSSAAGRLLGSALLLAASSAVADPISGPAACLPGGKIVAQVGAASAAGPGGSRPVSCGDELCAGDTVSTGANASAGILVGSVLTQLGPDSRARVDIQPQQAPAVELEQGAVRMIDPREGGAPGQLNAGNHYADISGNDVEAFLLADASGTYLKFCERAAPLHVRSGTDHGIVDPGSCATARSPLASAGAAPASPGIPALGGSCQVSPAFSAMAHIVPLPPVAAAGGSGPPLPEPPTGPRRSPCDVPGSGCGRAGSGNGATVVEQPPGTDPFPGGGTRP